MSAVEKEEAARQQLEQTSLNSQANGGEERQGGGGKSRVKARLIKSSGPSITGEGDKKIGGPFSVSRHPAFISKRKDVFDRILEKNRKELESKPRFPIKVTLPDGAVKEGVAWETTPLSIALSISKGLADNVVVAKVRYTASVEKEEGMVNAEEELEDHDHHEEESEAELWDLTRPLIGDCEMSLLKFDEPEGKMTFWHSSAHILGASLEELKGCHLTIGPPLANGFYYDGYMGSEAIHESDYKELEGVAQKLCSSKLPFERLVLSKEEALELFSDNPFKVQLIKNKIPDGAKTSVYKCGDLVDLCRGPHLPNTGKIKAFAVIKNSSAYWLGNAENDSLQRVYGIAFPDKKQLKEWQHFQEEAAKRDHRRIGVQQELFFFDDLSPGSCFMLPHGTRVYNKLMDFIRQQYRVRGYDEVSSPNIFDMKLWETSGHAKHYKDDMFLFDVENRVFGLKPMNCPGHCVMFDHRLRSYKELPIRFADFGVLHRNEMSGALSGLTRVRRFCQDDAHIFCRKDQIKQEILQILDFIKYVYGVFGMTYKLELSTKPAKAMGDPALWVMAEQQLKEALDETAGPGNWRVNPGDGAFYGPKIDFKVMDALQRVHQCATVQLDFQLPINFKLKYRSDKQVQHEEGADGGSEDSAFETPVIVHRAVLGSVERMMAVLIEHFGGKWPFWLSPRQVRVVPVSVANAEYAREVYRKVSAAGFYAEVDDSTKTLNKKIREGQLAQFNFILVVGAKEQEDGSVNIRTRDNQVLGVKPLDETLQMFHQLSAEFK